MDDVEARTLYDESLEAERRIGQRLADEVIARNGVWTPLMLALSLQLKEQARATATLRRQLVAVVAG